MANNKRRRRRRTNPQAGSKAREGQSTRTNQRPDAGRKPHPGKKPRGKRRRRIHQRDLWLLGIVIVIAIALIGGIEVALKKAVTKRDNGQILQGVSVGNVDVSGMSKKEATNAVSAEVEKYCGETMTFQLETGDTITATLGELGLEAVDLKKTIKAAERYGKDGNVVSAYKIIRKSEKGKLEYTVPLKLRVTDEMVKSLLEERSKDLLSLPENATVTQQNGAVTVIPDKKGESPDAKAAIKVLNQLLNDQWDGKGTTLKVAVKKTNPEVTKEKLADVTDLLGSYTTYYGADGSGRCQNVESGAMHLNGVYIEPGQEISANALMEPYTYENGYAEAASYEKNKVVSSMGGGICQVSTTLYNALLYAELDIVERYPHSMTVGYVDLSRDAAIADNLLDLVFKNNLEYPVYIESVLSEGNLTFNIYGKETRSPERSVEFESETTETKETTTKEFTAVEQEIGYMELTAEARPEISARLWKVVYENGEEVSRDIINYSTYIAAPSFYDVGVLCDDPALTEKMKAAIQAQDEKAVQAVIDEFNKKKAEKEAKAEGQPAAQ